jgi:hypothetical protein
MKIILTRKGQQIVISDEDYDKTVERTWHISESGYPATNWSENGKRLGVVYLHRYLMSAPRGQYVDHINRNKLDCTRENLRLCTMTDNNRNTGKKSKINKYKGITRNGRYGWAAQITVNRKNHYLGTFTTQELAALAYNDAAISYFGQFACLNEIV